MRADQQMMQEMQAQMAAVTQPQQNQSLNEEEDYS